ncbi:hypothetical protein HMPREF9542_04745 [Escherichia coli MS 117-3]|nr:hypothetical protein HMPREF9542_04745 [Escherichia coli MS 117-3]
MNALSAYISPAGRRHDKTRKASHQAWRTTAGCGVNALSGLHFAHKP